MSKTYFEAHITIASTGPMERLSLKEKVESLGWKFSAIDGDPVLGPGVKCYATTFFNVKIGTNAAINTLLATAERLEALGVIVTRRKIEEVLFDDRSDKISPEICDGACPECTGDTDVKS